MQALARRIAAANDAYHGLDAPTISDADYDALKQQLMGLETAHPDLILPGSPTGQVGAAPSEAFSKITHRQRMMSLENAFSAEDVADFVARIRSFLNLPDRSQADTDSRAQDRRAVAVAAL